MRKLIICTLVLFCVVILSGCAVKYKPINPTSLSYNSHDVGDGVSLSYKYDVLRERGNRKVSNKERKQGVKLIAVKVTNHTDSVLNIGKDLIFYSGENQLYPMEPAVIRSTIRQSVPPYLFYLLLTFTTLEVHDGSTTDTYPIGFALGPGIAFGNMALANSANKDLHKEVSEYYIMDKDVPEGETVYGIIGVRDVGYSPITVRLRD